MFYCIHLIPWRVCLCVYIIWECLYRNEQIIFEYIPQSFVDFDGKNRRIIPVSRAWFYLIYLSIFHQKFVVFKIAWKGQYQYYCERSIWERMDNFQSVFLLAYLSWLKFRVEQMLPSCVLFFIKLNLNSVKLIRKLNPNVVRLAKMFSLAWLLYESNSNFENSAAMINILAKSETQSYRFVR